MFYIVRIWMFYIGAETGVPKKQRISSLEIENYFS